MPYDYLVYVIPYVVLAPLYLNGSIDLGSITQVRFQISILYGYGFYLTLLLVIKYIEKCISLISPIFFRGHLFPSLSFSSLSLNIDFLFLAFYFLFLLFILFLPLFSIFLIYFSDSQGSEAFNNVRSDFSIVVDYFEKLSLFSAGIDRLSTFIHRVNEGGWHANNTQQQSVPMQVSYFQNSFQLIGWIGRLVLARFGLNRKTVDYEYVKVRTDHQNEIEFVFV